MSKKIMLFVLLILLGFAIGWFSHLKVSENQWEDNLLANWLERAGFHANSLKLLQDQNFERLEMLLLFGIELSLDEAQELVSYGAKLRGPSPNLLESLHRAHIQTERVGRSELAKKANAIDTALKNR